MKKLIFLTALTLLVILLACGICWIYADELLNDLARPQIEKVAGQRLDGEVRIGQLLWTEKGLVVQDLEISTTQATIVVPRINVAFTVGSLWQRQIHKLLINQPQVQLTVSSSPQRSGKPAWTIPNQIPFRIEQLIVADGLIAIKTSDRLLSFEKLKFSGSLKEQGSFEVSALFNGNTLGIDGAMQLSPEQNLTVENLSWQGRQILKEPLALALTGGEIAVNDGLVRLPNIDEHQLGNIFMALGQAYPLPTEFSFSLNSPGIGFSYINGALQLNLQISRGQVGWNDWSSSFATLRVSLRQEQGGWTIAGQFEGPARSSCHFDFLMDHSQALSGRAAVLIPDPGHLKATLVGGPELAIKGELKLTADLTLADNRLEVATQINGQASDSSPADYLLDISRIDGQGYFLAENGQESFSLTLDLASQPLLSASGTLQQIQSSLTLSGLDVLKQLVSSEHLPVGLSSASQIIISGVFSNIADNWEGSLQLEVGEAVLAELALSNLIGQAKVQPAANQFSVTEASLNAQAAYGEFLTAGIAATGFADTSKDGFSLSIEQLALTELSYNSLDGLSGAGGASFSLKGHVKGAWAAEALQLDLNGTFGAREVLAGVFYADLSGYQVEYSLQGELNTTNSELTARQLQVNIPDLGRLSASGRFSSHSIASQGHLDLVELGTSFEKHLKPLLQDVQPALADLELAGKLALDYQLRWEPSGWHTQGSINLTPLTAHWDHRQLTINNGRGSLPFSLGDGSLTTTGSLTSPQRGEIFFDTLSIGPAKLDQKQLQLSTAFNRFTISSPFRFQLAGGNLTISDFDLSWQNSELQGALKIDVNGVQLASLTRDLGLPEMQGNLGANLGTITYKNKQLATEGVARIEVFAGEFKFSNMSYSDPLSNHSTFYTDIEFAGLDLQQATQTFDFGEMNGILDGSVRGLQLYRTTPAAFQASMATRTSGTRNISVKALKNLSVLSQGGVSAALSRGIYQFIDFYRYRKIAFNCSLVNDTFNLIGTARADSNRYLVDGGMLPPRIDITISTPTISFKEMMKRLARIDRAGN